MYPAGGIGGNKELTDKWTWDFFLQAAEKCHKAGHPFGLALGQTGDTANWVGAVFTAYGAELVDKDGNITVKSDPVKQVLEWFKKLVPFLPPDVFAWDDSSNNKALISGQAALIMNPPSAWAVAVRDAPKVAEQCWHFPSPKGPKGRFDPAQPSFWGIWKFSPNKAAAKSLALHLWEKDSVEQLVAGSHGYDIPCFGSLRGFKTWAEEGPPKGGIWNYPPRGDVVEFGVRLAGPGQHRQPDLLAGDDGQDDRAMHPVGQDDRPGDRLGGAGDRRLQAQLTARRAVPCPRRLAGEAESRSRIRAPYPAALNPLSRHPNPLPPPLFFPSPLSLFFLILVAEAGADRYAGTSRCWSRHADHPEVLDRLDELTAIRRDIHAHPELGFEEERTAELVAAKLAE